MKKVLRKLKDIEILFKSKKYKFYKEKIRFLRFLVNRKGIYIDFTKVEVV